jgi:diamine N-acetyltransferase
MKATQPDRTEIIPAAEANLPVISKLAGVIWRACYPGIITHAQIDYMLARMYALEVMRDEICSQGIRYDLLFVDGKPAGFASYGPVAATPPSQKVVATPRRLSENHRPFETGGNAPGAAHSTPGDEASPPPTNPAFEFKLHKLYLLPELHGCGLGSLLLQHVEREVRQPGARRLILAVNKRNANAIAAYQRNGFVIAETVVTDIGGGFVMDDYVMAKDFPT